MAEILTPEYAEEGNVRYGVFRLNQDKAGKNVTPLVINLGLGTEASQGAGRRNVNAFAQTIVRPLIVIDMAGIGQSEYLSMKQIRSATFTSLAANHLRILDHLSVEAFDIVGNSMGAVMAAQIATLAAARAKHLVMFSSPGFETRPVLSMLLKNLPQNKQDFRRTKGSLPSDVQQDIQAAPAHHTQNPSGRKLQTSLSTLRYARLLTGPSLGNIAIDLSPATTWADIIGSEDAFSDWRMHVAAVEARNEHVPGSSSIKVLEGATHAWQAYYRWDVAAMTAQALEK